LPAAEKQNLNDQTPQPACELGSSATGRIAVALRCPALQCLYGIMNSA
jgi:hypothetical protein